MSGQENLDISNKEIEEGIGFKKKKKMSEWLEEPKGGVEVTQILVTVESCYHSGWRKENHPDPMITV